jgi:hypothetical protein
VPKSLYDLGNARAISSPDVPQPALSLSWRPAKRASPKGRCAFVPILCHSGRPCRRRSARQVRSRSPTGRAFGLPGQCELLPSYRAAHLCSTQSDEQARVPQPTDGYEKTRLMPSPQRCPRRRMPFGGSNLRAALCITRLFRQCLDWCPLKRGCTTVWCPIVQRGGLLPQIPRHLCGVRILQDDHRSII